MHTLTTSQSELSELERIFLPDDWQVSDVESGDNEPGSGKGESALWATIVGTIPVVPTKDDMLFVRLPLF